jgi:hypothetical protein
MNRKIMELSKKGKFNFLKCRVWEFKGAEIEQYLIYKKEHVKFSRQKVLPLKFLSFSVGFFPCGKFQLVQLNVYTGVIQNIWHRKPFFSEKQ